MKYIRNLLRQKGNGKVKYISVKHWIIHTFSKALLVSTAACFFAIISGSDVLNAQDSGDTSSRTQPNDTASSDEPSPPDYSQVYGALNVQMHYMHWASTGINVLAPVAEKKKIKATSKEIASEEKVVHLVFPDVPIPENLLKNEVVARKYCKTLPETSLSAEELKKAYGAIQKKYPNAKNASMKDILPMVETQALFEKASVQAAIKKMNEPPEEKKEKKGDQQP